MSVNMMAASLRISSVSVFTDQQLKRSTSRAGVDRCFILRVIVWARGRRRLFQSADSRLLFCGQFLKARIVADLIPPRIESQQRRSNRNYDIRYLQQPLENGNRVIG